MEQAPAEQAVQEAQHVRDEQAHLLAVGRLAAAVTHELAAPIQAVGDDLAFLASAFDRLAARLPPGPDDELAALLDEVPAALAQARAGVAHAGRILAGVRLLGRRGPVELAPVALNELVRTAAVLARGETRAVADVLLSLDEPDTVRGDATSLLQVLVNLLVNAAHAIAERPGPDRRGEISVRTSPDGGGVRCVVTDNGIGVPAELRERIFEPFFTTRPADAGTGQGLALARAVVERHHGRIEVRSEPGRWTELEVWLPAP